MKNILRTLLLPLLLLGGCCANDSCNCDDLLQDAVYFRLDASKYAATDIDTLYFQRFTIPDTTLVIVPADNAKIPITTSRIVRPQVTNAIFKQQLADRHIDTTLAARRNLLVLTNTYPFSALTTGGNIGNYRYKVVFYKGNVPVQNHRDTVAFDIRRIVIRGKYNADGCCTCYENTYKKVVLRTATKDVQYNVTENGSSPQLIPLSN